MNVKVTLINVSFLFISETPSFETPASTLASPYGMTKISSAVIGAGLRTPLFSKIATPVTSLGGPKRLTVQRASLEMSTILKGWFNLHCIREILEIFPHMNL